ncbi:MAG TPA: sulfate reduction electron transfer complex DsrMKJOP subunit DsrM [Anaeromyxobacteraceae bacterium]|nr:sulfate reduction electron transfer complex DsrMKJOP subunit DsrM [Anaeromyxobacteraceae bacterium]
MRILVPALAVVVLALLPLAGVGVLGWTGLFGAAVPYAAAALFLGGVVAKVLTWARAPVPFRIPTTCGQQRSLPWIRPARLENPSSTWGVLGRMALEVLAFRSLFRNTRTRLVGGHLSYPSTKWLWAAGLAFHYAFLVVLLRHLRFFTEPVPAFVAALAHLDGFLLIGLPEVYASTLVLVGALAFLFLRRVASPPLRYLSLPADYFALFLLLGIGLSGAWLRHLAKIDVPAVKGAVMGLLHLSPRPPAGAGASFYVHLFLVCTLLAYFPFSKLMHMAGVFLSPTRNLAANSRAIRHVNPWNHPVPVHTYAEYEDEFRARMRDAKIPVEKEA